MKKKKKRRQTDVYVLITMSQNKDFFKIFVYLTNYISILSV